MSIFLPSAAKSEHITIDLDLREVRCSNTERGFFAARGTRSSTLCNYYFEVSDARDRTLAWTYSVRG